MKSRWLSEIWEAPQNLLGRLLIKILKAEKRVLKTDRGFFEWHFFERASRFSKLISGASLGRHVLLPYEDETTIKHECGHSAQSRILGWLYLPVVGVYSAVFCNLRNRLFHKKWSAYDRHYWYYKTRWAERWADRLGGVDRDAVLRRIARPDNARYPAVQRKGGT